MAVERLGHDAGRRSLAATTWTGEKIGVGYTVVFDGIGESPDDRLLPDQIAKRLRSIFKV